MKFTKTKHLTASKGAALALAGVAVIGSASAYLTDAETATNTFTVGEVIVDLVEPNYPGNTSNDVKNLIPNQEVAKDPAIENSGKNDAIVFLKLKVPVDTVITANNDGTREAEAEKELFYFKDAADSVATKANNFNANWIPLPGLISDTDPAANYYLFGYSEKLLPGERTEALFDKVQLINVIEGEIDNSTQNIVVDAFAIQADHLLSTASEINTAVLDVDVLSDVYEIFFNQNEGMINANTIKDADTSNILNLKGN